MRKYDNEKRYIEFVRIPAFGFQGNLKDLFAHKALTPEASVAMLKQMLEIRHFELKLSQLKMGTDPKRPGFDFVGASHLYA
ncbi:MAG: hypothetical protein FJ279_14820, partial [Planctomycetes bacterium]|nr:hypothetical protein [Planctomycetota bacterium]